MMKREIHQNSRGAFKLAILAASMCFLSAPTYAGDVGVSVTIGQPGFYGHVDIGDYPYPQPRVIYREPVIVYRHVVEYEPIYLRVPPGHAKRWRQYCGRYEACDRPVFFVDDRWYSRVFVPIYRERHGERTNYRHEDDGEGHRGRGHEHGRSHHGH